MNDPDTSPSVPIGEWTRIFAVRFARSRPEVSAEQVISTAIKEFWASNAISPEEAANRCCNRAALGN